MDRPIPDKFPPGTEFFDTDGPPFVTIPGEGCFSTVRGSLSFVGETMPWNVLMYATTVSEDEFHRLVAAFQAER